MPESQLRIAIVGATGAVGREALSLLAEAGHPASHVVPLASSRSAGAPLPYGACTLRTSELTSEALASCDAAIFAADAETARRFAPQAAEYGCLVIDNSSAFRADPTVPLVIPEVNADALGSRSRLVANPNCSTTILLTALEPIRRACGITRIMVSTYQAVSGAGLAGIDELREQTRAALEGRSVPSKVFPESCAFNVFTHESPIDLETGFNLEERKLINETRRIWNTPDLEIIPTCVRVPVERVHSQSVSAELRSSIDASSLRSLLARAPGLELIDDPATGTFPTPLRAVGRNPIAVGRPRISVADQRITISLWICGDQLRKGAALNALQILDHMLGTTLAFDRGAHHASPVES